MDRAIHNPSCEAAMKLRLHRRSHDSPLDSRARTSSVHVLRDEEDLQRALTRAAEFDQRAADVLLSRSAHYRALLINGNGKGHGDDGDEPGAWSADGMTADTSPSQ
jgi:hypothetical protein